MSTLVDYPMCTVKKQLKEPIISLKIALRVLSHNNASICIYTGHLCDIKLFVNMKTAKKVNI